MGVGVGGWVLRSYIGACRHIPVLVDERSVPSWRMCAGGWVGVGVGVGVGAEMLISRGRARGKWRGKGTDIV